MKKIMLLFWISISSVSFGQVKTNNIGFGISPYGILNAKVEFKKNSTIDKMRIDYGSYLNANAFYERQFNGAGLLVEASYAKAKFEMVDNDIIKNYEASSEYDEDMVIYSGAVYGSLVINKQRRIQIPLYLGLGIDYLDGDPINKTIISLATKARVKFYFTNTMAIYGGYSYKPGVGVNASTDSNTNPNKPEKIIKSNISYVDLGLTFSF